MVKLNKPTEMLQICQIDQLGMREGTVLRGFNNGMS